MTTVPIDPNIQNDKRIYVLLVVLNILLVPNWTGACLTILVSYSIHCPRDGCLLGEFQIIGCANFSNSPIILIIPKGAGAF